MTVIYKQHERVKIVGLLPVHRYLYVADQSNQVLTYL